MTHTLADTKKNQIEQQVSSLVEHEGHLCCNGAAGRQAAQQEGQQVQPVANEGVTNAYTIKHLAKGSNKRDGGSSRGGGSASSSGGSSTAGDDSTMLSCVTPSTW